MDRDYLCIQEDQEELEHITRTELGKYEREKQMTQNSITKEVTEVAIGMMHPSLKEMALQNMVMKKVNYLMLQ